VHPQPATPPVSTHTARGESEARDLYQAITLRLAQLRVSEGRALRDVLKQVTDTVANALQVQRVSVWFFVDEQRTIRCDYLYEKDHGDIYEGAILHACDFPEYFKALTSRRVVRFVDCAGDPMSEELRNSYLGPLGITAMLDAPLYQHGEVVGIVCHEHLGHPREWTDPESEFVASVGDIVARIYVEAAQLRAQDQLRIQDTRLAELQQLAELGRLATGVAHDINNVLGAVFSYVDLVTAAAAENGEVNRLGTELSAIVERGRELTQTLLMLGRANSERPRVTSPADVLNTSLALLRGAAGPRVRVQTSIAANISRVLIDPLQLERAVLNLVVNARDAMPLGGVITVELREETIGLTAEHQSTFVVLEVIDTGTGMDSATRDHMFETYFTTKGAKGKGLGLAIVNQVVTLAGGFIQADSTPGQGTRVRLYLPRIAADESVAT
jgi:two-component system cell cycle sensor histidine kinase/response regulator CckA